MLLVRRDELSDEVGCSCQQVSPASAVVAVISAYRRVGRWEEGGTDTCAVREGAAV